MKTKPEWHIHEKSNSCVYGYLLEIGDKIQKEDMYDSEVKKVWLTTLPYHVGKPIDNPLLLYWRTVRPCKEPNE